MNIADQALAGTGAALAILPPSVTYDPPVPQDDHNVPMPSCPSCGEGTVILYVCGKCGNRDGSPDWCCSQRMHMRGAYVSLLPGNHSWLGCIITDGGIDGR